MSTTTLITIWCDYEREPLDAGACSEWFADTAPWTAKEARALAERVGWRYVPRSTTGPARDFCPKHAITRPAASEDEPATTERKNS